MHITGDISLGSIAIIVTLIGIAIRIGMQFGVVTTLVTGHTLTLSNHAERLDRYEKTMIVLGGDMQRMIGRIEATQDRIDRNTGYRPGEGGAHHDG